MFWYAKASSSIATACFTLLTLGLWASSLPGAEASASADTQAVEVKLEPLGVADQDLQVGGAKRRTAVLKLNTDLVRRVVLNADDLQEATLNLSCRRSLPGIDVIARGAMGNGKDLALGDEKSLQGFELKQGEELIFTVWKPVWHWYGGAEAKGLKLVRLGPGAERTEVPLPETFENGTAKTDHGTFTLVGLFNRDRFPECEKRSSVTAGSKPGQFMVSGGKDVELSMDKGTFRWFTQGRANWDAGYSWAPALIFTPTEGGTYALSGALHFFCGNKDHDVSWLVGRYVPGGAPLTGTSLALYRLLKEPESAPKAGTDFEREPLAVVPIPGDGIQKPVVLSVPVTTALRAGLSTKNGDHGILLVAEKADGDPAGITIARSMKGIATVKSHPKHMLFDTPVKPKPGVYATMKDGRLYYGDRRLRLWGVVEGGSGERNRRLGYNCLRIWHQADFYDDASAKKGEVMTYSKGDGSKLDKFDRQMASMKENDVFIMFASMIGPGMPMKPLLEDDSWIAGGDDWTAWKEACQKAGGETYRLGFVDDRLFKIRLRHAENVLNHVNPYTGKRYAEEEIIALYEINNESGMLKQWLEKGFADWPPYFQKSLTRQWNAWLTKRYGSDEKLRAAWDKLENGESLKEGTIQPAPVLGQSSKYPRARQVDFITFLYEMVDARNQAYRDFCRAQAPKGVGVNVVPFSFDTQYRPSIPWLYTNWLGDTSTVSMYFWSNDTMLGNPPGLYVLDSHRLDNKLSVIYETQRGRPSPYRTEYPYMLSVMTDWQDFDVVVWHGAWIGDPPDEQLLARDAAPPNTNHFWQATHLEYDPVMSSAIALAGRLYLGGYIGTAPDPAIYTVGKDATFSFDAFHGIGGREMSINTFTRGTRIRFQPETAGGVLLDGKPLTKMDPVTEPVATGTGVLWDWPNQRLIIDQPGAKIYVGKTVDAHRFKDGITLSGFNTPFIAFALISTDGKPLTGNNACRQAYVCATFDAKNTGFDYDYHCSGGPVEQAKAVKNAGHPPIVVDPVSYTVSFPFEVKGHFTCYDFAMRQTGRMDVARNTLRRTGQTDWMSVLEFSERGGVAETVCDPSPGAPRQDSQSTSVGAETTDPKLAGIPHPLPDLSWGDSYRRAHRLLRDGTMRKARVSPEDLSQKDEKRISIDEAEFLMKMPANVEVLFIKDRMRQVNVEFKQAPSFVELVAQLEKTYGAPAKKNLTNNAFEQSEVSWEIKKAAGALIVFARETQGVVRVAYALK